MKDSIETKIKIVFALLVSALLGVGAVLYASTSTLIANGEWLKHSYEVVAMIDQAAAELSQVVVATHNYLVGGENSPAKELATIDNDLQSLKVLTADNDAQQSKVALLHKNWIERRNILEGLIQLRPTQGSQVALNALKNISSAQRSGVIREAIDGLRRDEQSRLEIRTQTLKASVARAWVSFLVLAALASAFFAWIWFLVARYMIEHRRSQSARAHERRLLRTLIDNMPDYIYAKDTESRLILSNVSHARALGAAEPADALGKTDADFLPKEMAAAILAHEQALLVSGQTFRLEEKFIDGRGNETWFSTIKVPLRDSAGNIVGLVGMSRDIEEFKELERSLDAKVQKRTMDLSNVNGLLQTEIAQRELLGVQLHQRNHELEGQNLRVLEANRHKSEFLANMSHELRTPLNCIIGFSELMHDAKVGPVSSEHKEYLGDILSTSRHLLDLINGVLDLAKVESGNMEFSPEPIDIKRLVFGVTEVLRNVGATNRINVEIEVDPFLQGVVTDSSKLKQIVYNYLSNALKFTPEEGRVTVRVRTEGVDHFRLEVEDTGCGISPADQKRLFTEFVQLDAGTAKKHEGTGLGLALTSRIVEAQGGHVGVKSAPGGGSLFFAVLPRISQIASAPPKLKSKSSPNAPTVLVVEDEQRQREWLVRKLSEAGYEVYAAANGLEALTKTRVKRFDAITLDLLLSNESGWDLLNAIRAEGPNSHTPVIVVSIVKEKDPGGRFRIDDFLSKPVKIDQLLSSLQRAGASRAASKVILAIDDDPITLRLVEATLGKAGYQAICRDNGVDGLLAAVETQPCAVILDLLMPGMDGMEFLRRFRETANGQDVPVLIWTNKDLTSDEIKTVLETAQGISFKDQSGTTSLMGELVPLIEHC